MFKITLLFVFTLIWILFAVISDIKTREIPNWLNFSLILFALGFRFFYFLFEGDSFEFFSLILTLVVGSIVLFFNSYGFKTKANELVSFWAISFFFVLFLFLLNFEFFSFLEFNSNILLLGVEGLMVFFILGNLFYYTRIFAGGDAKLMISLGVILPISSTFMETLWSFALFLLFFFIIGAAYSLIMSLYFGLRRFSNLKKEFKIQFGKNKNLVYLFFFSALCFLILSFFVPGFFYLSIPLFLFPYLYFYLKSVDEVCMIKEVSFSKLTLGDWLYRDIHFGKKVVKATWDGLNEEDLKILKRRNKKVLVRYGVQFAPVFLISFVLFWVVLEFDLFEKVLKVLGF